MTDELRGLHADIAFLKTLAEEGRSTPLLGGSILVSAGALFGAASIAHWLVMTGRIAASPWAYPVIWLGATVVFLASMPVIRGRLGGPRAKTGANRAVAMVWQGVGWTIFALWGSLAIVCWRAHSALPSLLMPSIVLALYGMAWMVAAALTGRAWIWLTALGSYAGALVLGFFSITSAVFLVFAAAMALLALLPGLVLVRQAGKTV